MHSRSSLAVLLFVLAVGACVAGGGPNRTYQSATTGTGGMPALTADSTGEPDPNDTRNIAPRQKVCTDPNDPSTCTCLRLALVGTVDSAANEKDTGPFVDWLNAKSDGTATATMVPQKPTITAD